MSEKENITSNLSNRQNVTVLFADIVGYTSMMGANETEALSKLNFFKEKLEYRTSGTSGKIIQYYGDAALVTFDTPIEALVCAKHLQKDARGSFSVPLRLGLHTGEVVFKDNNVFGDTVNIASRLESMGVEGSILFSEKIKNAVEGFQGFQFTYLGSFSLKNVSQPLKVFALADEGLVVPTKNQIERKIAQPETLFDKPLVKWGIGALLLILLFGVGYVFKQGSFDNKTITGKVLPLDRKSIAVLPFANLSNDKENLYLCDGMMEDILNKLSSIKDLRVISRTSVLHYRDNTKPIPEVTAELNVSHVLEGSIQKIGNQIRVVVSLVQGESDQKVWSESYDRVVDDVFRIQADIAERVWKGLELTLLPKESSILDFQPTDNPVAYDLFLKGREQYHIYQGSIKEEELEKAYQLFNAAIDEDRGLAIAWAYLGKLNILKHTFFGAGPEQIDTAMMFIQKSIELHPDLPEGFLFRSEVYELRKQLPLMEKDLKQALALAPNSIEVLRNLGNYYVRETDDLDKSIPYYKKAITLEPFSVRPIVAMSNVHKLVGNFDKSIAYLNQAVAIEPERLSTYMRITDINLLQGNFMAAQKAAKKIIEINPDFIWGNHILAEAYAFNGEYPIAEKYYRKVQQQVMADGFVESYGTPPFRHRLGFVLYKMGKKIEAEGLIQTMIDKNINIVNSDVDNLGGARYDLAAAYAFLSKKDKAIYWTNRIFEDGSWFDYYYMDVDPLFDPIRDDERFQEIMTREKLNLKEKQKRVNQMEEVGFYH